VRELVMAKRISKAIDEYRHENEQLAALREARRQGQRIEPGQKVSFVILASKPGGRAKRVRLAQDVDGSERIDTQKYLELLARAGEALLAPFLERPGPAVGGVGERGARLRLEGERAEGAACASTLR